MHSECWPDSPSRLPARTVSCAPGPHDLVLDQDPDAQVLAGLQSLMRACGEIDGPLRRLKILPWSCLLPIDRQRLKRPEEWPHYAAPRRAQGSPCLAGGWRLPGRNTSHVSLHPSALATSGWSARLSPCAGAAGHLLPNAQGRRAALEARGVALDLGYTSEDARNPSGGDRHTGTHAGQLARKVLEQN